MSMTHGYSLVVIGYSLGKYWEIEFILSSAFLASLLQRGGNNAWRTKEKAESAGRSIDAFR